MAPVDLHNGTIGFFGCVSCWLCSHDIMNHPPLPYFYIHFHVDMNYVVAHYKHTPLNTTFTYFPNIHSHSAMSASPRVALGEWVLVTLGMVGSAKNLTALLRNLVFKCCSSMLGSTIWTASSKQTCIFLYLSLWLHFSSAGYFLWQVFCFCVECGKRVHPHVVR